MSLKIEQQLVLVDPQHQINHTIYYKSPQNNQSIFLIIIKLIIMLSQLVLAYNFSKSQIAKRVRLGRPGTSLKMGLLGMANIGKSSTFNILSNLNVPAQNIPFCTIDPNTAYIQVKDEYFQKLCKLYNPAKKAGKILRIVDIAGLVKGASQGFGMGNQFLSHVTQVDGLYHVVRAYPGQKYAHTQGSVDSLRDINIIKQELIFKDMDISTKKLNELTKKVGRTQDKNIKLEYEVIKKVDECFKKKLEIRNQQWDNLQIEVLNKYLFLTSKPMVYLINASKKDYLADTIPAFQQIKNLVTQDGKFETNIIKYSIEYQQEKQSGQKSEVDNIIKAAYQQLQLCHFYTVGTDQVRAWAIRAGQNAQQAGGKIHTDFKKTFISAQVLHSSVLISHPQYKDKLSKYSKKQGKAYIVKDGDILHFNCKIK